MGEGNLQRTVMGFQRHFTFPGPGLKELWLAGNLPRAPVHSSHLLVIASPTF